MCATGAPAAVGRGMNNEDFAGALINARAPALPGLVAVSCARAAAGTVARSPRRRSAGPFGGRFGGVWGRALLGDLGMSVPSLAGVLGRSVHLSPTCGPFTRCKSDSTTCAAAAEP